MFNITSGSKEGAISIGLITNMFLALSHFILFSVFRLSPAHCMGLVAFGKGTNRHTKEHPSRGHPSMQGGGTTPQGAHLPTTQGGGWLYIIYFYNLKSGGYPRKVVVLCKIFVN